jgi:surface polysaccharide O-acyltransferase-like enzyme
MPPPNPAWSLMRCVFAFEICLIHLCSLLWFKPQEGWLAETIFMSAARTGTVGFMMLAGAILIGRGMGPVGDYLATRLRRWLPVLVLAQALYLGLDLVLGQESRASLSWRDAIEPAWYHLWFFYALGTVYLMVVPMRWYAAQAARLPPGYRRVALWGPVAGLLAGLAWITATIGFWGDLRPLNLLVYCGYAWTGHVLATTFPAGTPWAGRLMLLGVGGATLATTLATEAAGAPVPIYFHRCTVFVALAAMGQFLLLLRVNAQAWSTPATTRLNATARLTLGIFVVHPLLIALGGWPPDWVVAGAREWVTLPVAAATLFAVSGLVTWATLRALAFLRSARPAISYP